MCFEINVLGLNFKKTFTKNCEKKIAKKNCEKKLRK